MTHRTATAGLMGLCRALNLLMGLSIVSMTLSITNLYPAGLMWLYITSVTVFARQETGESHPLRLTISTLGVCVAVAGLAGLYFIFPSVHLEYLSGVMLLIAWLGFQGFRASIYRTPEVVQPAMKTMILSLVLFDAGLVWSLRGYLAAMLVVALLIPSTLLSRKFQVT